MLKYDDIASEDYVTVGITAEDPADLTQYPSNYPARTTPADFTFTGLGIDKNISAGLHLQVLPFNETGFTAVQPEAVLVALIKYYEGLQRSTMHSADVTRAVVSLKDALGILKSRNDRRAHYGTYGTDQPTVIL